MACDFKWQLLVHYAGTSFGPPEYFDTGFEILDGTTAEIDADFSAFAGKAINVTFVVNANGGASTADIALWVHPRIVE